VPDRHLRPLSTGYHKSNVLGGAHPFHAPAGDGGRDRGDNSGWIAAADGDQFERDVAAIERATAILRRAEPTLQSWAEPVPTLGTPRPLWQVIGVLWFSAALATLSAIFAIYVLVG
jgi:hypothetical protein